MAITSVHCNEGDTALIPTFVISLPDCAIRRQKIAARMAALSLPFDFLDAIDGRQGLSQEHESTIDRDRSLSILSYPLSDAEFGCALSHIEACRKVLDRRIPYAMILEDDAIPQPDLPRFLESRQFQQFDLTQLCYSRTYVRPRNSKHLFDGYTSYLAEPGVDVRGAVAYIVSLDAAKHIVQHALPVVSVADWPVCTEHFKVRQRWHLVHPRLVEHARRNDKEEPSIIRPTVSDRKRRFLGVYVPPWPKIARSCKSRLNNLTYPARGFRKIDW